MDDGLSFRFTDLDLTLRDHWILGHMSDQGPSLPTDLWMSDFRRRLVENGGGHQVLEQVLMLQIFS